MDFFEQIGGWDMLKKVNKIFYDKIYAHPWLKLYFQKTKQEIIESQQTDFVASAIGGPDRYGGRFVLDAHTHIMITEELFLERETLLKEALQEAGAPQALADKWLKIDNAFKKALIKKSVSECKGRYATEPILDFSNPNPYKKTA